MTRRFWQAVLGLILLAGFYLFLPPGEIAMARQWIEMILGRLR